MVLLAGGVAANRVLRDRLGLTLDLPLRYPALDLCTDNAAMVAAAAHYQLDNHRQDGWDLDARPDLALV